ncbi:DUF420 domain-containing protein [Planctellipticum variicoloris]|uniref:DUF420 domain-containing protein n=1 Tax=Planctellipticum variicoloris TaxID=3064265 RepID=UPI00301364D0|nr:DUF420 domain-containing protein [Planctomycetaceae bacterium SH412]
MAAPDWVLMLPAVNASLNGVAAVLLLVGYWLIKTGRRDAHKRAMLAAFGTSVVFLICYLVYHAALHHYTGESGKKFPGTGVVRTVYLAILLSHILLAFTLVFLPLMTIYRAWKQQWERHRKIARITFPIWVYVSVTGVIIYLMLYHWPQPAAAG